MELGWNKLIRTLRGAARSWLCCLLRKRQRGQEAAQVSLHLP